MTDDRPLDEGIEIEHEPTVTWDPTQEAGEGVQPTVAGAFAWALTIEGGPQTGLTYVLGPGNTVAGRSGDCAIFLPDVTVSREHARFSVDPSGLSLTDLGSTNGTYVNGARLDAGQLAEGDELMIGKYHLRVSRGHG